MGLLRYTAWRLLQAIPVLLGIITIVFFLVNAIPGDPVEIMLGPSPNADQIAAVQAKYGLDKPLHERYLNYLVNVAQGDLGESINVNSGMPVAELMMNRLPITLLLTLSAFAFAIVTAVPLGVISAKRRNESTDHVARVVSLIGVSTPSFWIGLMLIIVFALHLDVFPSRNLIMPWTEPGTGSRVTRRADSQLEIIVISINHLLLPMISLGTLQMAQITRIERSTMVETLQNEYIKLARAYGVSERTIMRKHAFRPAQLPVITIIGLGISTALGGSVLIETVFEINGMGRLIIQGVQQRDYPVVMGTTLVFGLTYLVGVIITDISYAYIDPRVKYGDQK
ncbi:ABC transporter permease [Natrinema ejinorense]|uniref:ABC transporter permease n=1 Tax=Natrinema ejinorense TaxID=373386 RepID=A0A2A5QYX2_9EURY|nr:ABC transporter permease [Natrinema ejinorense]PCR92027.1 ABC transporter permease [Natrinema ejinorense]